MMVWDFAWLILLEEAFGVGLLLLVVLFARSRSKHEKEIAAIESFIGQFEKNETIKCGLLETILLDKCGLSPELASDVLQNVLESERALLQRIVQMLLSRDPKCLAEIEQLIVKLSEPYCNLLVETELGFTENHDIRKNPKVVGLEKVNKQLVRQLETAMQTIDEISSEYTRVFSGHQTLLELDNSSKKMQQIFKDIEQSIKQNIADMDN
jgi:hypothetical protein